MPVTTYATVAMFFQWGLPQTALGSKTVADVQSALDAASSDMDDYFRGVYPLPFASVGLSVSRRCVAIARNIFMGGRGFSPVTGADEDLIRQLKDAEDWCDKVQRKVKFPDVVIDPTAQILQVPTFDTYAQPLAVSSSVVNSDGCRAPTRGW